MRRYKYIIVWFSNDSTDLKWLFCVHSKNVNKKTTRRDGEKKYGWTDYRKQMIYCQIWNRYVWYLGSSSQSSSSFVFRNFREKKEKLCLFLVSNQDICVKTSATKKINLFAFSRTQFNNAFASRVQYQTVAHTINISSQVQLKSIINIFTITQSI